MRILLLAVTVSGLAACGGGGSSTGSVPPAGPPAAANTAPTITGLTGSLIIAMDSSNEPVAFNVADAESPADAVKVTVTSSNSQLFAPDAIQLSGNAGERALLLRPAEGGAGTSAVTITATDAQGLSVQRTLDVSVTSEERSFHAMVDSAFARAEDAAAENTVGYNWVDNPEDDDTSFDRLLSE